MWSSSVQSNHIGGGERSHRPPHGPHQIHWLVQAAVRRENGQGQRQGRPRGYYRSNWLRYRLQGLILPPKEYHRKKIKILPKKTYSFLLDSFACVYLHENCLDNCFCHLELVFRLLMMMFHTLFMIKRLKKGFERSSFVPSLLESVRPLASWNVRVGCRVHWIEIVAPRPLARRCLSRWFFPIS